MGYEIQSLSYMKRHWLLKGANIPSRFIGMEPEDIVKKTGEWSDEIEDWLDMVSEGKVIKRIGGVGETGGGLLFDGKPGLGKTTHAVVTLMELVRRLPEEDEAIKRVFGERGLVEMSVLVGTYNMHARFVGGLDIELEKD